jgi:LmbE family N-acetylglucosaminyl deacetylase
MTDDGVSDRSVIIAPHPDDEAIGAAIWMSRQRRGSVTVIHLTDGSPRDPKFALAAGFESREEYAAARRRELYAALALAGISRDQCIRLGFVDQEIHHCLRRVVNDLVEILRDVRPRVVLVPPYEGGHPDHDSAAFAARAAHQAAGHAFSLREYRLYHAGASGDWDTLDFLPKTGGPSETLFFSAQEREKKAEILRSFRSQADVLARFPVSEERFRDAPQYDFTRPPHSGELLYERWQWGIRWKQWREGASNFEWRPL